MRNRLKLVAAASALGLGAIGVVAPSAAAGQRSTPSVPGVSSTSVTVGALMTLSGVLAADFGAEVDGVKAYFAMVNASGGVNGRQINLKYVEDDGSSPTNDVEDAHQLVQSDHVFAVVGVGTAFFPAASYLVSTKTPTYGYAVENNWSPAPNMFAAYGSYISFQDSAAPIGYLIKQTLGKQTPEVGLLAYNVAQSSDECQGLNTAFKSLGIKVAYVNNQIPYLSPFGSIVERMALNHVNYVVSCMDEGGDISLEDQMHIGGMGSVKSLWFDGYDRSALNQNQGQYANASFLIQHVPFEAAAAYPHAFPGLTTYLNQMNATYPADTYSEVAMEGWQSAALFVQGLEGAGKNPTQASLVTATNAIKNFTANGLTTPVNWSVAHSKDTSPACEAFVSVSGSKFQLALNRGTDPWVCFPLGSKVNLANPVAPPAGSPGA